MTDEALDKRKPPQLFRKGQSGNPAGRPHRIAELQALAQANYPLALKRLAQLIESRDEEMAFKAVSFCFCYILGKPAEARDLHNIEVMRARLTELVLAPAESAPVAFPPGLPEPKVLEESVVPPALTSAPPAIPTPPEAPVAVTPDREPSGLHCLYRGKGGKCESLAMDGSQWCEPHRTQLFSLVTE